MQLLYITYLVIALNLSIHYVPLILCITYKYCYTFEVEDYGNINTLT